MTKAQPTCRQGRHSRSLSYCDFESAYVVFEIHVLDQAARLGHTSPSTQACARKSACFKSVDVPSKSSASLSMKMLLILRTKRRANKLWEKLEVNWRPAKSPSSDRLQISRHRYGTVHERLLCTLIQKAQPEHLQSLGQTAFGMRLLSNDYAQLLGLV